MIRTPLSRLAAALAVAGAIAIPVAAASAHPAGGTKVSLHRTSLGMILVNARGRTLYAFTKDSRNRDRCVTTAGCTGTWPVATSNGRPHGGAGVKGSLLSTIRLPNGSHQITYAGRPLYTYVGDSSAGETGYVGVSQFGGTWLAVNGAGTTVK